MNEQTRNYWKSTIPPKEYTGEDYLQLGKAAIAMRRVNQAIANGTLERASRCQVCGSEEKTVAHHHNGYDDPFNVWWVCRRCNHNLPHDGSIDLETARKIVIGRYFKRPMHFYNWLGKQTRPCDACGAPDKVANMIIVYDTIELGKFILCQYCYNQMCGVE